MKRLPKSAAFFFDFDGVLVDSTEIKTNAYRELYRSFGPETVSKIVAYHQLHGGISRFDKIVYTHKHFLDQPYCEEDISRDVEQYSRLVFEKVVSAKWIPGAHEFIKTYYQKVPIFIISGTPEDELQNVTRKRNMDRYFLEILGSPIKKPMHVRTLVERYHLDVNDCFFIGDALTDYHAAKETGVPFIGIQSEVEFPPNTVVLPDCCGLARAMNSFST